MEIKDLLGDGYREGMTDDEIKEALKAQFTDNSKGNELANLKSLLSDRNSEIAKLKKDLREHQTDEEARKAAEKEEHDKLVNENQALKEQVTVSTNKANLVSLGYSESLAEETAKAMYAGETDKVLANQKKFLAEHDKAVLAEYMQRTPAPGSGSGTEVVTKDAFLKMGYAEQLKYIQEHPEWKNELKL